MGKQEKIRERERERESKKSRSREQKQLLLYFFKSERNKREKSGATLVVGWYVGIVPWYRTKT